MVTAVMAAPVPPPTMAAIPIMAQVVTPMPSTGANRFTRTPKAPPSVAPMNKDGEKIPPDAPDPRLIEVAAILAANKTMRSKGSARLPDRIAWIVE